MGLSLLRQIVQPDYWVIVDDHSTDGTWRLAEELVGLLPFASAIRSPLAPTGAVAAGAVQGRDVAAFEAGVAALPAIPEFIGKLDADVALDSGYYESLLAEFADDPELGVTGGTCYEDGQEIYVTEGSVRGAARLYRWACWADVSPLEPRLGWDGIDLTRAQLRGWGTRSVAAHFDHLRPAGARR